MPVQKTTLDSIQLSTNGATPMANTRPGQLPVVSRPPACRQVNYLHHTRDRDGDAILYFSAPPSTDVFQSSTVRQIARLV